MEVDATPPPGARYAYLVSRYPAVTHTFIAQEIKALRETGVTIETVSVRRAGPTDILSDEDRREYEATRWLVPARPAVLLTSHLGALVRAPLAYLKTLRDSLRWAVGGPRAVLWQLFYFGEAMLLWNWMRTRGLRHVHVHFPNVASDVALLATLYANRSRHTGFGDWTWSMTLHGPTEFADVQSHKLGLKVACAAAVICISDFTRTQVMACTAPRDWPKLRVVRCGVDTTLFAPSQAQERRTARSEPWRVLNVAALSVRKGQLDLLEAIALLRDRSHDVSLEIVGEGPERSAIEGEVRRLGLESAVALLGARARDDVRARYAECDVFCLPSFSEGIPIVLMEAMACEVPVVATRINGIPELVIDGSSGLLVPPGRADLLADALERILTDEGLRSRLARGGRAQVLGGFDIHRSSGLVGELLAVASHAGSPGGG